MRKFAGSKIKILLIFSLRLGKKNSQCETRPGAKDYFKSMNLIPFVKISERFKMIRVKTFQQEKRNNYEIHG